MTMLGALAAIPFPDIDPVIVQLGPFALRWYALAYIGGIIFAWRYTLRLIGPQDAGVTAENIDDLVFWCTLGVILGGRFGYVLFYNASFYAAHPAEILRVWVGGMSFHGGILGVSVAVVWYALKRKLPVFAVSDLICCAAPMGLFLGRVANFVNGELYGRVADLPWAVVFPAGGPQARHPSQLYEAGLEGIVLLGLMWFLFFHTGLKRRPGALTGIFVIGYAAARAFIELFRQPDDHLGFITAGLTMGQLLSIPMAAIGFYFLFRARPKA